LEGLEVNVTVLFGDGLCLLLLNENYFLLKFFYYYSLGMLKMDKEGLKSLNKVFFT